MYPRTYYETFMRYEANDQVFVAMPFSPAFERVFETIIQPAIVAIKVRDKPLHPRIINRGTTGSPDIHEQIFDAIIHSRLVIADMTVQSTCINDSGTIRWQPNANVAYEVGLACAWRNPEDILLIHQPHPQHNYSFDVQNLRHVSYDASNRDSVRIIADELVRSLNSSTFLARHSYLKIIQELSPSAIQFMHQECQRAFPVVAFNDHNMPIMDCRIHAATELLSSGALKNRNVIRQGEKKGVAIVYQWTELGLRMLLDVHAISVPRYKELVMQIRSVPNESMPPNELLSFPEKEEMPVKSPSAQDIAEATETK